MIRSLAGADRCSVLQLILAVAMFVAGMGSAPVGAQVAAPAPAQPAAPAAPAPAATLGSVKDATKQSGDANAIRPEVQAFMKGAVEQLANGTPDMQSKARQALSSEILINGQPTATQTYMDIYAQELDQALLPLVKNKQPRVRINAAIAAATVAQNANNSFLKNSALAFINDPSDAVVLWGLKTARWIIPAQLAANPFDPKLADAIVPAVQKHTNGQIAGPIALDAYDALALDVYDPARLKQITPAHIKTMVPYVMKLLAARLAMYQKGVPAAPRADAVGSGFIGDPNVWKELSIDQKKEAMQVFSNLIGLAGQQAKAANPGDLVELTLVIQRASASISITDPKLREALAEPANLKPGQVTAEQVQKAAESVPPILRMQPQYKDLKNPPAIQDTKAAPAPASAPTTGPVVIPGAPAAGTPGGVAPAAGTTPGRPAPPLPAPAPGGAAPRPAPAPGGAAPRPTPAPPNAPAPAGAGRNPQ